MKRVLAFVAALISAAAFGQNLPAAPQNGMWWNPAESGRGYNIDTQGNKLVFTMFAYDDSGQMQWWYADGNLTSGGYHWEGTLLRLNGGQPLHGAHRPANIIGSDGVAVLDFQSRVKGTLRLPSGLSIPIQRMNFGAGDAPQALLGEWMFAYSIGSSNFLDRYKYDTLASATANGNGVVLDGARRCAAELQVTGSLAGFVAGFRFSSTGTVLDQYLWVMQVEEGRGSWVSPTTFNQYGMNVYKTATPTGISKVEHAGVESDLEAKGVIMYEKGMTIEQLKASDPDMGRLAEEMWKRVSQ